MTKLTEKELNALYLSDYDSQDKREMFGRFWQTYDLNNVSPQKNRFIKFSEEELKECRDLAEQRFNNNRKNNKSQIDAGCGDAVSYLERDYPGMIGEKAFQKYIEGLNLQNLNDITEVECVSKDEGSDKGDFLVKINNETLKFEVKCNQFDKNHNRQLSLNVQEAQIETLKKNKPNFFVQIIMIRPDLAYVSGYADWFDVQSPSSIILSRPLSNGKVKPSYRAVQYNKIRFFELDNIPKDDF